MRTPVFLAAVVIVAFLVGACGGGDATGTPALTPRVTASLSPTPTPTATTPTPTSTPTPSGSLNDFVFTASELPEACSVVKVDLQVAEGYPSWLSKISSNPFLSSDREFVDGFVGVVIPDTELASSAISALFAIYYEDTENNEIGLFGYEFDSDTHAWQAAALIIEQGDDPDGFAVFLVENIVIYVWRDEVGSVNCFLPLKELVSVRTEIGGGLEVPTE